MNNLTLFTRLRDSLRSLNFTGTSQRIFGDLGVFVVSEIPTHKLTEFQNSSCWIRHISGSPYLQNPTLFENQVEITFFVHNLGDDYNEGVMLGRNKDSTTKAGWGVFEIEQEIITHLLGLTSLSGSKVTFSLLSIKKANTIAKNNPAVFRTLIFSVISDYAFNTNQGNESNILRMPGRIFLNPTDLSSNYGTLLGYKQQPIVFESDMENSIEFLPGSEDTGDEYVHAIFTGANPYAILTLLEHSDNVMKLCFPSMVSSSEVRGYGTLTGDDFANDSNIFGRLLFVPDDETNNKILILQKVVPLMVKPMSISRSGNTEYTIKLQCFRKTADADGIYYLGTKGNGVLR